MLPEEENHCKIRRVVTMAIIGTHMCRGHFQVYLSAVYCRVGFLEIIVEQNTSAFSVDEKKKNTSYYESTPEITR